MRDANSPVDPTTLREWCLRWLHSAPTTVLFQRGHVGWSAGVELENGRRVVIKVRPWMQRVVSCIAVQRVLFHSGFPCPEPLVGPTRFNHGSMATAEAHIDSGGTLCGPPDATASATLLARLVALAPKTEVPLLGPTPPWAHWDHELDGIWPEPEDLNVDLNVGGDPSWVDELGRSVRAILVQHAKAPEVVGHVDWEAHNMAWNGDRPTAVWDWDSVAVRHEPAIAGLAAAVYPSTPDGMVVAATIAQTEAFLQAYAGARGRPWRADDTPVLWAAGLWVLAYNAKKESLGGGKGYLAHLAAEGDLRLKRALTRPRRRSGGHLALPE